MAEPLRYALARALTPEVRRRAQAGIAAVADADGALVWEAFGSRADGEPVDAETVFRIASMSKSFLAALALRLRDDGEFDLDAPLSDALPHAVFRWQGEPVQITGVQVISNRSGLPEDNAWGDRLIGISRTALRAHAEAGLTLAAPPGVEYQYSNTGMALLAAAIEAKTGRTTEELVHERFLAPLGLTSTVYDPADLPTGAVVAAGARTFDDGLTYTPEPVVGPGALGAIGGMWSTAGDIATWMRFLASAFGDDPIAPELLSRASRLEMQTARTLVPLPDETTLAGLGYGYGLVVEHDRRFGRIVQHAGGLPGWSSHMRWHAATGTAVVVFGTSDSFAAGTRATEVLRDVLTAADAPAVRVRRWPETLRAADAVTALLRSQASFAELAGVAADNLLRDMPAAVRDLRLADLLAQLGPVSAEQPALSEAIVGAGNAGELRWLVACERGRLQCDIRLVGLTEPLLQTLTITGDPGPAAQQPIAHTLIEPGGSAL